MGSEMCIRDSISNAALIASNPDVGDKVDFYWPLDSQYYPGVVAETQDGHHTVVYDDGDLEIVDFNKENGVIQPPLPL